MLHQGKTCSDCLLWHPQEAPTGPALIGAERMGECRLIPHLMAVAVPAPRRESPILGERRPPQEPPVQIQMQSMYLPTTANFPACFFLADRDVLARGVPQAIDSPFGPVLLNRPDCDGTAQSTEATPDEATSNNTGLRIYTEDDGEIET